MLVSEIFSRVQANFGDSNQVMIFQNHVIDWINEGMLEIVRETQCLSATNNSMHGSDFYSPTGAVLADLIIIKRIYYDDIFLQLIEVESLGRLGYLLETGTPWGYYTEGSKIFLYPSPTATDTKIVTIVYVPQPVNVTDPTEIPGIPTYYHGDLADWCLVKAHERNENYKAAEVVLARFRANLAKRKFESLSNDDTYRTISPDIMDLECGYDYI